MSIIISCACGKSYQIKEQLAGQRVQCSACQRILTVPGAGVAVPSVVEPRNRTPNKPPAAAEKLKLPPQLPKPVRSRKAELVVDLPLAADDDASRPHSFVSPVVLVILGALLLAASGAALFLFMRAERDSKPAVASTVQDSEKDIPPVEKKVKDQPPERLVPEKKEPERKEPERKEPAATIPPVVVETWPGHSARILAIGCARDGRSVFSAAGGAVMRDGKKANAADTSLRTWDAASGKELKRLDGFTHGLSVVAFDPTGSLAVVADVPGTRDEVAAGPELFELHVWDLAGKRELRALKGHNRGVLCAAFTPDGRHLLSGGRDAKLRIWDVETGMQIAEFAHPSSVNDVAVSSDGRLAVTACSDRTVRVFDLLDKKVVKEMPGHQDIVWSVALSPDGKYAASGGGGDFDGIRGEFVPGSRDYEIRLWDVSTGKEVRRFPGHSDQVRALAFSPDGRRLLSGSHDSTVRLWHVASGRELGKFSEHTDWVESVAFLPEARQSLSGGYDKTLRLWTLPPDAATLAKRLQDVGTDRLTTLREIASFGTEAKAAVPELLKVLHDPDPIIKRAALDTLHKVGTVSGEQVELLVPLLKDAGFPEGRQFALDALTALGRDARPVLPEVVKLLKDGNPALRLKAIAIISAIGADAKATAFTPLLGLLRDPDMEVSRAVPDVLAKLGKPSKADLPELTNLLADKSEPLRQYAVLAITDLGGEGGAALPALLPVLEHDSSAALRLLALSALLKIQTDGKALLAPLTKALTDRDPKVVVKAAEALAALPPETGVLPVLIKTLENQDPAVVKIADDALEKFPFTKQDVKLVNEGLQNKNEAVRLRMLKTATKLGADAAEALPGLIVVVKSSTGEPRMTAIDALANLGPAARAAGPSLAALLKESDPKTRLSICIVLGKIEAAEAKQALPFLVGLLKLPDPADEGAKTNRETANKTLVEIGEPAVDDLLKAVTRDFAGGNLNTPLGLSNAEARLVALQTLSEIGKQSKVPIRRALLPLVKIQREDPAPQVKAAARQAYLDLQK